MLAQLVALAVGVWLLLAPGVLMYGDPASSVERVIGPIVILVAALAMRNVTRSVRIVNAFAGLALLIAPWVFAYDTAPAIAVSALAGMALLGLALVRGHVSHRYAGGWLALWSRQTHAASKELAPESHQETNHVAPDRRYRIDASEAS